MTHPTDNNQPDASERSPVTNAPKKKLIETSLPLEAINAEASREKSIRHGHPSTLHLYWARRPLAAARAVLFAQLVDDPSSRPEEFPTVEAQDAERARLHALLEKLVVWENSNDETLLRLAREEIRKSNNGELPAVLDPFAGGGAIPLEAQRLGLEAHASDLNPLAVLINKALIEIPPKFAGKPPVYPGSAGGNLTGWSRAEGLAEDVRRYGEWMRDEAEKRIGHLYPKVTAEGGTEHTVIAWIWARTVKSPNPANPIEVPLVRSWWLCKKKGKEAWVQASVVDGQMHYEVRHDANGPKGDGDGTRTGRGAVSIADGTPISGDYLKAEGSAGRMGAHLIAIVAEGNRGRLYLSPTAEHRDAAAVNRPAEVPEQELPYDPRNIWTPPYGLTKFSDLFTNRQLVALTTLSDLVAEAREKALADALAAGLPHSDRLENGGTGAEAYADAIATYLGLAVSRMTDYNSSLTGWNTAREGTRGVFARQAIPMVWDYVEVNPFSGSSGNFVGQIDWIVRAIDHLPTTPTGFVTQSDAASRSYQGLAISTDPPYYDNIGYSDLSDFFYVWIRRSLAGIQSRNVGTMLTPKTEELVANPYRHDGRDGAERFFIDGFNSVFARIRAGANPHVPLTVYYAYKQQDTRDAGTASTGWHTLLDGLIDSGWEVTATWPMRSERGGRMISVGTNALASSIVLACRPRPTDAPATTRRAFVAALKSELPEALRTLMQGAIAPVDLAQAAIGPGISVFSRYSRVREADGSDMSVKDALLLINATLDEVLGEQESDFDPDTRFAVKWYRQYGWTQESSGIADQLARSSDTSIGALERGGIFEAKGGKACLLSPSQLESAWDPAADEHVSVWEATVRLAAVMAKDGADKVAELLPAVQTRVNLDAVKELGFLLFHEAEKKKDTKDAILFNGLVSAWGDVNEQAREYAATPRSSQQAFDFDEDED
jgi:putative DNA methylase